MNKEKFMKFDLQLKKAIHQVVKEHDIDPSHVNLCLLISSLRVFLSVYQLDYSLDMSRSYLKFKVSELIDDIDCTELAAVAKTIANSADPGQALKDLETRLDYRGQ